MNFGSLAAVALLTAWAGMASAQTKEHVFKIGTGLWAKTTPRRSR